MIKRKIRKISYVSLLLVFTLALYSLLVPLVTSQACNPRLIHNPSEMPIGLAGGAQSSNPLYGVGALTVHVNEIFGTIDNPQFRPLEGVLVKVKLLPFGSFCFPFCRGITNSDGWFCIAWQGWMPFPLWIDPTYTIVSKSGFHAYGSKPYKVNPQLGCWFIDVYFTMAADGSPFTKQSSHSEEPLGEYPDFPKNKMVLIGKYSSIEEHDSPGISRSFEITCGKGDISVFGGEWKKSGYSSWVYVRFHSKEYVQIKVPKFIGICKDGQISGITFGDFSYK